jgi:acetoin utilization deacetylase AcuC-like enzyme
VYVQSLFRGGASLEAEIMRAFELVQPDGRYYRYSPNAHSRPLTELFDILLSRGGGTLAAGQWALGLHPDQLASADSNPKVGASLAGKSDPEAFYCGGGFHHAMYSFGEGFCLYNDVLTVIRRFQTEGSIQHAWIIDVDAHKGDGTAALTQDDPSVATLSIHMAHGWPLDITPQEAATRQDRSPLSFLPSTVDIGISRNEDCDYCIRLSQGLDTLWNSRGGELTDDSGRKRRVPHPDLVYVLLGADPFEEDELPSAELLSLSRDQMCSRDRLIRDFFTKNNVPTAYLMAGNYGESSWKVYSDFLGWCLGME